MMYFRSLAKKHWEKFLPGFVKELKAEGIYEQELDGQRSRRRKN